MRAFDMLIAAGLGAAVATVVLVFFWIRHHRRRARTPAQRITAVTIAERVRGVGRLVGLEVYAKEIATATQGLSWMPPLLLSQARLAMIFSFRKQYYIDLARLEESSVEAVEGGRYRVRLPEIGGDLHLMDVTPYDIQDGRALGLLDVIPMNAVRQGALMEAAREQASDLYERNSERYLADARRNIERHLRSLLRLFEIEVEIVWPDAPLRAPDRAPGLSAGRLAIAQ